MIYPCLGAPGIISDRRLAEPHVVSYVLEREIYLPSPAIEVRFSGHQSHRLFTRAMSYANPMQQIITADLVSYVMFQAIHRMSWAEYVSRMEEMRSVYTVLVEKLEGKK